MLATVTERAAVVKGTCGRTVGGVSDDAVATVESLGEELGVDPDDVRVVVSQDVDLHYDEIPGWMADEVRATLSPAGDRAQVLPPRAVDTAMSYRESPDELLLQELRQDGLRVLAHALLMERLLPEDEAEVYSVTIDEWMTSRELGDTRRTR